MAIFIFLFKVFVVEFTDMGSSRERTRLGVPSRPRTHNGSGLRIMFRDLELKLARSILPPSLGSASEQILLKLFVGVSRWCFFLASMSSSATQPKEQ